MFLFSLQNMWIGSGQSLHKLQLEIVNGKYNLKISGIIILEQLLLGNHPVDVENTQMEIIVE